MTRPTPTDEIRELYAYHRWANRRVLDAVEQVGPDDRTRDLGNSFPSILDTLVHMLAADWVWLERWQGRSPEGMPDWDVATLDALRDRWREVEDAQARWLDSLDDEALERPLAYRNTRGAEFRQPLWQLLRHVVNHGTYHRGQVIGMLRRVGGEVPGTDLVLYYRETAP